MSLQAPESGMNRGRGKEVQLGQRATRVAHHSANTYCKICTWTWCARDYLVSNPDQTWNYPAEINISIWHAGSLGKCHGVLHKEKLTWKDDAQECLQMCHLLPSVSNSPLPFSLGCGRRTEWMWRFVNPLLIEIHSKVITTITEVAHKTLNIQAGLDGSRLEKRNGKNHIGIRMSEKYLQSSQYVNSCFEFWVLFYFLEEEKLDRTQSHATLKSHNFRLMITEMENWYKRSFATLLSDRLALSFSTLQFLLQGLCRFTFLFFC